MTDEEGNLVEGYQYDAYGKAAVITDGDDGDSIVNFTSNDVRTSSGWSSFANPYQYTGQRYDAETQLYYYKNRYYDTDLGRFTSRDHIGYEDSMNLYEYAHGSPIIYSDVMGLDAYIRNASGIGRSGGLSNNPVNDICNSPLADCVRTDKKGRPIKGPAYRDPSCNSGERYRSGHYAKSGTIRNQMINNCPRKCKNSPMASPSGSGIKSAMQTLATYQGLKEFSNNQYCIDWHGKTYQALNRLNMGGNVSSSTCEEIGCGKNKEECYHALLGAGLDKPALSFLGLAEAARSACNCGPQEYKPEKLPVWVRILAYEF